MKLLGDKPFVKSDPEEPEDDDGKSAAARAVMSALKSGDAAAFQSSMEDFIALCSHVSEDY